MIAFLRNKRLLNVHWDPLTDLLLSIKCQWTFNETYTHFASVTRHLRCPYTYFSKKKMSCNKMKAMTPVSCWKCNRLFKIHRNTCSEDFDEPNSKWMYVSHFCNFSRIIHNVCYWIRIQIDSKCIMCFKKCARNLLAVFNWNKEAFSYVFIVKSMKWITGILFVRKLNFGISFWCWVFQRLIVHKVLQTCLNSF